MADDADYVRRLEDMRIEAYLLTLSLLKSENRTATNLHKLLNILQCRDLMRERRRPHYILDESPIARSVRRAAEGAHRAGVMSDEELAELKTLMAMPETEIDTADIPEVRDWSGAKRGMFTREPGKRSGKPCIRGMRITIFDIMEYLMGGMTPPEILRDFPDLTDDDLRAVADYADSVNGAYWTDRPIGSGPWMSGGPGWTAAPEEDPEKK